MLEDDQHKPWQAISLAEIELRPHRPVELTLDNCIKCNICVTACPVTAVTDLFPGPKYEGPQAARFRQPEQESPDASVDYCSGCRVCNMVCPTGVRIAEINARARGKMVRDGRFGAQKKLRNNLIGRPETLSKLGQPLAPLANLTLKNRLARWVADKAFQIDSNAPLPQYARYRFTDWYKKYRVAAGTTRQIAYFYGCSTDSNEPRVGKAAVYVLEANGFEVLLPKQNCCGLPLLSNGEFDAAWGYHERNVESLVQLVDQGMVIVGTSTSCTLTLKEEAPELLDFYSEDAQLVAANTYDIHEFLSLLFDSGELRTEGLRPIPLTLAYHQPCQFKAHRVGQPSLEMMRLIPQLSIIESHADCCGVAGTYGYKREKYDIAMAVGQPLFEFVRAVDGPVAVCDSETCRWQITHATGVPAIHPIELLAYAYGYEPEEGPLKQLLDGL
jgi:glycerol-3-phosphate dehydrogenase subunit C